jgi:hypothetical protein
MLALFILAAGCGQDGSDGSKIKISDATRRALAQGETVSVVVGLRDDVAVDLTEVLAEADRAEVLAVRSESYAALRDEMIRSLPSGAVVVARHYDHLPFVVAELSSTQALEQMVKLDEVEQILDDELHPLASDTAAAVADLAETLEGRPAGTVAVLDTGVDFRQGVFGACDEAAADCKVVFAADVAVDDGSADADGHGTELAAQVIAGFPGSRVAALDVVLEDRARTSDILSGIEWSIAHRAERNIGAIVLALGDDEASAFSRDVIDQSLGIAGHGGVESFVAARVRRNAGEAIGIDGLAGAPIATAAPTNGSIKIGGASNPPYTKTATNTLALSATGATQMCISNTTSCSAWITYATSKSWTMTSTNGTKTVRVWYKNAAGEYTVPALSDTIILDTAAPTNGTLAAEAVYSGTGYNQVNLSWTGFTDGTSGLNNYKLATSSSSMPANCSGAGAVTLPTTQTTAQITGLTVGSTFYARVCAVDRATNTSTGASVTILVQDPFYAYYPPYGYLYAYGNVFDGTAIDLDVYGYDSYMGGDPVEVCVSTTIPCTGWQAYTEFVTINVSGSGLKTIYAWFKDARGIISNVPAVDAVLVDVTVPTNGKLVGSVASGVISLNWSGFGDADTGIAGYKIVRNTGTTAPLASCTAVEYYYSTLTWTESAPAGSYTYRVCAVDKVGLVSTGATLTVTVP